MADNQKPTKLKTTIKKPEQSKDWESKIQEAKAKKQEETPASDPIPEVKEPMATKISEPVIKKDDDQFQSYYSDDAGQHHIDNPPYVPTDEEKQREAAYMEKKDGDASSLLHDILGCNDDIEAASKFIRETRENNKGVNPESNSELKEIYDWGGQLRAALEDSDTFGNQRKLLTNMIDALNRHDILLQKLDKRLSISKITSDLTGKPRTYKGNEAIQLINNRYRGVYKVQLPNSGFWIKLTPLTPANMDAWIHEVDYGYKQLGRLIGGHFYLGFGVYLKQKLADLLNTGIVVDSNLANWKEGTNLVDSISINDYDTLCWAFSTIMHRNGITISVTCPNPDCRHHSEQQYVDLARCMYVNPEVLTKEAMEYLIAGNGPGVIRTKEQLKDYRQKLMKNRKFITFNEHDQLELVEPTLGEYIRTGMNVLGKLAASVKDGKLDITDEETQRQTAYQLSTMFSPWVHSVLLKNDKNEIQAIIDDPNVIPYQLETIMSEKNDFIKNLEEFMTNSKASFFVYVNAKCPKCGKQPDLLKGNLVTLDMEYVLFCLSYLKLGQIGTTF